MYLNSGMENQPIGTEGVASAESVLSDMFLNKQLTVGQDKPSWGTRNMRGTSGMCRTSRSHDGTTERTQLVMSFALEQWLICSISENILSASLPTSFSHYREERVAGRIIMGIEGGCQL